MVKTSKYLLSFTAASLRLNETIKVAETAFKHGITNLKEVHQNGMVFSSVKSQTSIREFREIRKRLENLTPSQLDLLITGDFNTQKQITFLAVCKHYNFIRDFVVDVILNKSIVYDFKVNESDYISFIHYKIHTHSELEEFSESTLKKAKQVLFHILEQAGIINNAIEKLIIPQLIHPSVVKVIYDDDPSWLKIFLVSDNDIKLIKY
jgi:hypothetical protein